MFIDNKYKRIYFRIIDKAVSEGRTYDKHTHEYHHIIPRCFGGNDVVPLTFKEHYICHHLLTKFTVGKAKSQMMIAFFTFFVFDTTSVSCSHRPKFGPSAYARYKAEFSKATSELSRRPISKEIYSYKHMETGEIFTGSGWEFKEKYGLSNQEIYNLKSRLGMNKRFHSKKWGIYDETCGVFTCDIKRTSAILDNVTCECCGYSASPGNFNRWHGVKIPCASATNS